MLCFLVYVVSMLLYIAFCVVEGCCLFVLRVALNWFMLLVCCCMLLLCCWMCWSLCVLNVLDASFMLLHVPYVL